MRARWSWRLYGWVTQRGWIFRWNASRQKWLIVVNDGRLRKHEVPE